jgi:putative redox protein
VTTPNRVLVDWKGERNFEAGREGRPSILIDGDGQNAPSPPDVLLAALASCVSVDVVDILAKRRTPAETYHVEVLGERVDSIPRKFNHITLNFTITGAGIDRENAMRAIELSATKYCSVRDSLDPNIPIVLNLNLNGSDS